MPRLLLLLFALAGGACSVETAYISGSAAPDAGGIDSGVDSQVPPTDAGPGTDATPGTDAASGTDSGMIVPMGDIYVDDDANPGTADGSLLNPYVTINDGVAACPLGGTVVILAGTYGEIVVVSDDCNLIGVDREQVILNAGDAGRALRVMGATATLSGITITGGTSPVSGGGVRIDSGADVVLRDCVVTGNEVTGNTSGAGIAIVAGSNALIERCLITENTALDIGGDAGGLLASNAGVVSIYNSVIAANSVEGSGGGLRSSGSSVMSIVSSTIAHNVATSSGGIGCSTGTPVTMVASIFWGNQPTQIGPSCGTTTESNVEGGGAGAALNADPLFVDPASYDYHLTAGSPCRDFSPTVTGARLDDYDAAPRDATPDIGADEFGAP